MHSQAGLQACRGSSPKVAVLDTVHGAATIAERMADLGLDAVALEVYHSTHQMEGFDLVVSPVHLYPGNQALAQARKLGKSVITHHRAVGEIIRPSSKAFEITGTRGKTTTALILSRLLSSRLKVVSHTTRGIELWKGGGSQALQSGLSIAPANVIKAMDAAEREGAEALVCEVSLGGTGVADCSILTSFEGDYRIAGGTAWASTAKLQMISLSRPGTRLIAGCEVPFSSDISFGNGGWVRAEKNGLWFGEDHLPLELYEGIDLASYLQAIAGAAAAAFDAGISPEEISSSLEGFEGLSGRMKVERSGGTTIYDNSNSGLKVSGVERALDLASGHDIALVVGEESEAVCEGMDIPRLTELLRRRRSEICLLVLVGARLEPYALELKASVAPDLAAGYELALTYGAESLLSCVKCFR
jgi:coenzyme F430 synthetase